APAPVGPRQGGRPQDPVGLALEAIGQAYGPGLAPDKPLSGLAEKDLARGIHEPEDPMRIKRKDRHVYLLDDRREKRRSLNRSAPLGLQDVAQAVDLG